MLNMATTTKTTEAIRLSVTPEIRRGLRLAKRRYPIMSDPEILKLGLSKIITENKTWLADHDEELEEIRAAAAQSMGSDYLSDPEEDIYTEGMGKKVNFK